MATSLSLSKELLRWMRADPSWSRLPLAQRALMGWKAHWGSLNARLSASMIDAERTELQAPVLIVGPWRSGTTVMHELLYAATDCATPLTWQCMNATAFALQGGQADAQAVVARPMDGLDIGARTPQEDEFALLTLGAASAYRAFLQPQRLGEVLDCLDQQYWLAHSQWLKPWETFLRGVVRTASQEQRTQPLILKSPNHTFRLQAILRRFPQARLVWMGRTPADVWFSNQKMWRAMFAAHALRADPGAGLDTFLVRALQASADTLNQLLDQDRPLVYCSQEALRADPRATTARVLRELDLPRAADAARFEAALASTARGKTEIYREPPPESAGAALAALAAAQLRAEQRLRPAPV
jgi:hypothetical protein